MKNITCPKCGSPQIDYEYNSYQTQESRFIHVSDPHPLIDGDKEYQWWTVYCKCPTCGNAWSTDDKEEE